MVIQDRVKRLFFTTFRPKKRLLEVAILTKKRPKTALNTQKSSKKGSEQTPLPSQWRIKKMSSLAKSAAEVLTFCKPLLRASTLLIMCMMFITFIALQFLMPVTQSLTPQTLFNSKNAARSFSLFLLGAQNAIIRFWK